MTLNITVLTETRIFQSSDFRLSTRDGPLIVPAMKMIVVEYPRFSGFICYTGFAKRDAGETKDTGDYIEEWLEGTADMRMDQVAEHLRAAATAYIADRLGSDLLPMRLTITLTAFIAHVPRAVIVSNFENTDGKVTNSILSEFQLSWVPFRKETGPVVLITGKKGAVGEHERTYLLDIVLGSREDSGRIRQEMEALNRRAASTAEAEGGVSEECVTVSIDSSGGGSLDMGAQPGLLVRTVYNGFRVSLERVLTEHGLVPLGQLKGAAFATNRRSNRGPVACREVVVDLGGSGYTLQTVLNSEGVACSVLGIRSDGVILGEHALPEDPMRHRYWQWHGGDELDYLDLELTTNAGGCVGRNDQYVVSLGDQTGSKLARLNMIVDGGSIEYLECPDGMGSPRAYAMNVHGEVVGSIDVNLDAFDATRERPAFWDSRGRLHRFGSSHEGITGRAVDINEDGDVLVCASRGRVCLIWARGSEVPIEMPPGVVPMGFSGRRVIVGFDRTGGRDTTVISADWASWEELSLNDGFEPAGTNDSRAIVGRVKIDGYLTPWIIRRGEMPILLSTFQYHHATPQGIDNHGRIVGTLSADNEQHIVMWSPPGGA